MSITSLRHLPLMILLVVSQLSALPAIIPGDNRINQDREEWLKLGIGKPIASLRDAGKAHVFNTPGNVTPLVTGTKQVPVVPIQFRDRVGSHRPAQFDSMLFGSWPSGSLQDYYHDQSYNRFTFDGTVANWVTSDSATNYWYQPDSAMARAGRLVKEAARKADPTINYASYDNNHDGYVDLFACIWSGRMFEANSPSPHTAGLWNTTGSEYVTNDPDPVNGGFIKVDAYCLVAERHANSNHDSMAPIGVFCHEWGHGLGLPDLYNSSSGGNGVGLGVWDIMSAGSSGGNQDSPWRPTSMSVWSKMFLGWINPRIIRYRGARNLPAIETDSTVYCVRSRARSNLEYFLFENRRKTGWDTLLPGAGLLIYHIDDSVITWRYDFNKINAGGTGWRYGVALEQADGHDDLWNDNNFGDAGDPWPGSSNRLLFDSLSTTPNSRTNFPIGAEQNSGCAISGIPVSAPVMNCTLTTGAPAAVRGYDNLMSYEWQDNDAEDGPVYSWYDITQPANKLIGRLPRETGDTTMYPMPFDFYFYNRRSPKICISSAGWVQIDSLGHAWDPFNESLPSAWGLYNIICPLWQYNVPEGWGDSTGVYAKVLGSAPNRKLVITWLNVCSDRQWLKVDREITFQAVLGEDSTILFQYKDVHTSEGDDSRGAHATIGIENRDATGAAQYLAFGWPGGNLLDNGRAIRFRPLHQKHDVGARTIVAPAGYVDSGTTIVPACTLYNWGNMPESYRVRMKIGSFYNRTVQISNHAPAIGRYVTFPAHSAWPRMPFVVTCSTELSGDAVLTNNRTTIVGQGRITDCQVKTIVAPAGTVDSGATVTPRAVIRNSGTVTASGAVRFIIPGAYIPAQNFTALAAGDSVTLSFTNARLTLPRGSNTVRCSLHFTGDQIPANDVKSATIDIRVRDVEALLIATPAYSVDSGTTITPQADVYNPGTHTETFDFRFRIGSYTSSRPVSALTPGESRRISFDPWTAGQRGAFPMQCSTRLTGDMQTGNDFVAGTVLVTFYDVEVVELLAPSGTVDSGTVVIPRARIRNNGTGAWNFPVHMQIGNWWHRDTIHLDAGQDSTHSFPAWTALQRGDLVVRCTAYFTGDRVPENNRIVGAVSVRVRDIGLTRIMTPGAFADSGSALVPTCSTYNYGSLTENYVARMRIGGFYSESAVVSGHRPGYRARVTFPVWTVAQPMGAYPVVCSVAQIGDVNPANNRLSSSVTIRQGVFHDVGVSDIVVPGRTADSGTAVTPSCVVRNFGNSQELNFRVHMRIGAGYDTSVNIFPVLLPGGTRSVTFPVAWLPQIRGYVPVTCSTSLGTDANPNDDALSDSVLVRVHDVGITQIVVPAGAIDSGTVVTPVCTLYSYGNVTERYDVRLRIGTVYDTLVRINHPAGSKYGVAFPAWTAQPLGYFPVTCTAALAGDVRPADNRLTGGVTVRVRPYFDAAARRILAPLGTFDSTVAVTPRAVVANVGNVRVLPRVFCSIYDSLGVEAYVDSILIPNGIGAGDSATLMFQSWPFPHHPGGYTTRVMIAVTGDENPDNDVASDTFRIPAPPPPPPPPVEPWLRLADLPGGPKDKNVKDGGALAFADDGALYALKGNNRYEVYAYNTAGNTWITEDSIPAIGRAGRKKAVKKGSTLTAGEGLLYGAKGNNSVEWWQFDPYATGGYPWTQLADVPLGAKTLREGTSSAFVTIGDTSYVYLLKGSGTQEFYRFNTQSNAWQTMAPAPLGVSGRAYKKGSALATDGTAIFALKGSYNEFYVYDPATDTWTTRAALPLIGSSMRKRKAGDGAGLAYLNRSVYALKGNNVQEFWHYVTDSDKWIQDDDMPVGGGKKPKGGAALAAGAEQIFALKGNNSLECFRYLPDTAAYVRNVGSAQSSLFNLHSSIFTLRIAPNPWCGSELPLAISYSLPASGNISLKLYDITGKLVTSLAEGFRTSGTYTISVNQRASAAKLNSGIFILKLETETSTATTKLIVE